MTRSYQRGPLTPEQFQRRIKFLEAYQNYNKNKEEVFNSDYFNKLSPENQEKMKKFVGSIGKEKGPANKCRLPFWLSLWGYGVGGVPGIAIGAGLGYVAKKAIEDISKDYRKNEKIRQEQNQMYYDFNLVPLSDISPFSVRNKGKRRQMIREYYQAIKNGTYKVEGMKDPTYGTETMKEEIDKIVELLSNYKVPSTQTQPVASSS